MKSNASAITTTTRLISSGENAPCVKCRRQTLLHQWHNKVNKVLVFFKVFNGQQSRMLLQVEARPRRADEARSYPGFI